MTFVAFSPTSPFPQTPRPGECKTVKPDGVIVPKDGDAVFEPDAEVLVHGARNDDIAKFYEVVEGPALRAFDTSEVEAVRLPERKAALKQHLQDIAADKRLVLVDAEQLERFIALTGRALSIAIKVIEGHLGHTGYGPVQAGVVTSDEVTFMRNVRDKGGSLEPAIDAEDAIESEIEAARNVDDLPTVEEMRNDSRWTG